MPEDYSEIFREFASNDSLFQEAFSIVKANSQENAWLIGGAVYRNLAHLLYNAQKSLSDFDFIIEKPSSKLSLPHNWKHEKNSYGNPKFVSDYAEIDFVPLSTVHSIIRRGLELTFQNYITGTPLTVQSIGYNIITNQIESDIGINAMKTKTVAINNPEQAKIYAIKKEKAINEIINEKAKSLGFTPIFN